MLHTLVTDLRQLVLDKTARTQLRHYNPTVLQGVIKEKEDHVIRMVAMFALFAGSSLAAQVRWQNIN